MCTDSARIDTVLSLPSRLVEDDLLAVQFGFRGCRGGRCLVLFGMPHSLDEAARIPPAPPLGKSNPDGSQFSAWLCGILHGCSGTGTPMMASFRCHHQHQHLRPNHPPNPPS